MGYYATSIEGTISIPITERYEVLNTIREAYAKVNEQYSFANCEVAGTLEQELEAWGFEWSLDGENEGDQFISVDLFDGKWRTGLDEFITALLIHATEESAMGFRGEDGEMWRFAKGVVGIQTATIVWS